MMLEKETPVLPVDYFDYLLKQECKLAERYTHCFTVVSIEVQPFPLPPSEFTPYSRLIRRLTRYTDIIGFFPNQDIAMILHHVDDEGIQRVAHRLYPTLKQYFRNVTPHPAITIGAACFPIHATTPSALSKVVLENKIIR